MLECVRILSAFPRRSLAKLRLLLATHAAGLSHPVPLCRNLPSRRFEDEAPRRLMTRAHGVRLGLFSSCYQALI